MPQLRQKTSIKQYLTPKQVATLFQVKETTVRLWLRRGLLRGVQVGRSWRIPQSAIEIFDSKVG